MHLQKQGTKVERSALQMWRVREHSRQLGPRQSKQECLQIAAFERRVTGELEMYPKAHIKLWMQ